MKLVIDLNADLGEDAGHDEELLELVSSASIATGAHAGDANSIAASIQAARKHAVAVGAHPSFPDRENFGRREMQMSPEELTAIVREQIHRFREIAIGQGVAMRHVKPHGALYNMAASDHKTATAVVRAVCDVDQRLLLFAPPGSTIARVAEEHGVTVAREVFADRNYMADGGLVPRSRPDALLHDPGEAATRVIRMLREGFVRAIDGRDVPVQADTVCLHGDTPQAVEFACQLRSRLGEMGVEIAAPRGD